MLPILRTLFLTVIISITGVCDAETVIDSFFERINSAQKDFTDLCDTLAKNARNDYVTKSFMQTKVLLNNSSRSIATHAVNKGVFLEGVVTSCCLIHMAIEARTSKDTQRRAEYKEYVSSHVPQLLEISTGKLRLLLTAIATKQAIILSCVNE